jgi:malate dehydrogenase (oxaloacetate-decarboxylating)(NADP+)
MQANFAFNKDLRQIRFPLSKLADMDINTVIFPNLSSGNIAYKMMQEIGGAEAVGPISTWFEENRYISSRSKAR